MIRMRKLWKTSKLDLFRDEGGQATVEYIITLMTAVAVVSVIATGFRRSILLVWQVISKEVTAACPGCPAEPSIRFR
jgi:Flp pilus assembly pilin Flp